MAESRPETGEPTFEGGGTATPNDLKRTAPGPRPGLGTALLIPVVAALLAACVYQVVVLVGEIRENESGLHGADFAVYYAAAWAVREGVLDAAYDAMPKDEEELANPHMAFLRLGGRRWEASLRQEGRRWSRIYSEHLPRIQELPYLYPPTLAVALVPLTFLSFETAYGLFIALNLGLIVLSILAGIRLAGRRITLGHVALSLLAIHLFTPVYLSLFWGQVAGVLSACWAGSACLVARGRKATGGILVGLGAAVKLTPALLLPFMLVRREWRWCGGFGLGLLIPLAFSALWVGGRTTLVGLRDVPAAQTCGLIAPQNVSLTSAVAQLLTEVRALTSPGSSPPNPENLLGASELGCTVSQSGVVVLLFVLLASVWFMAAVRRLPLQFQIAAVAALSLALSPVSWIHAYAQILFPLALLLALRDREAWVGSVAWGLLAWLTVGWVWQSHFLRVFGTGVPLTSAVLLSALVPFALYSRLQFWTLTRDLRSTEL